jgi:tellurite resistance protein
MKAPRFPLPPIGAFGAVMGLAGLGLSARAAAPVLAGAVRAPAHFTEPWILLAALAFAWLLPAYLWKLVRAPQAVLEEFADPSRMGFCATLPLGMTLLGGGLAPYLPAPASVLCVAGAVLLLGLQAWALWRLLAGGIELARVNASWLILFVGGIVVPGPALALGHEDLARFSFGVSASLTPFATCLVLFRAVLAPPLPEAMRPTWFILLVPPTLIYANGIALYRDFAFLGSLYFLALVLATALIAYARGLARWPFGAPWWAITFPLDALAFAAAHYAGSHPGPLWMWLCAATLLLATLAMLLVLARGALALRRARE